MGGTPRLVHHICDWDSSVAIKIGRRQDATKERIWTLYVTEEQLRRRTIFIATLRAGRILAGCFGAHRSKTTVGILPLRFAHPAKIRASAAIPATDIQIWCTRGCS